MRRQLLREDAGTAAVEMAVLTPALITILLLMVAFGRVTMSEGSADAAARDAARAASLTRDAISAEQAARQAAARSLAGEGIACTSTAVSVDTGAFALPVGETGSVTVTVVCTAPLGDIALPGIPGSKALRATHTSPLDAFRARS